MKNSNNSDTVANSGATSTRIDTTGAVACLCKGITLPECSLRINSKPASAFRPSPDPFFLTTSNLSEQNEAQIQIAGSEVIKYAGPIPSIRTRDNYGNQIRSRPKSSRADVIGPRFNAKTERLITYSVIHLHFVILPPDFLSGEHAGHVLAMRLPHPSHHGQ